MQRIQACHQTLALISKRDITRFSFGKRNFLFIAETADCVLNVVLTVSKIERERERKKQEKIDVIYTRGGSMMVAGGF